TASSPPRPIGSPLRHGPHPTASRIAVSPRSSKPGPPMPSAGPAPTSPICSRSPPMAENMEAVVERVDGFVARWEARMGFGAQTSDLIYSVSVHGFEGMAELNASDLRALLS